MSSYRIRPESIVNQIRNNLLDRYDSGYPILKELLQNADDASAHRFRLDARAGWPNADNPLLRGPGLLIVNDGAFRREDQEGILSFGESVKATDEAAIGKFGFGQKAVFHLCDAFVVHAFGQEEPFSDVVNPFEDVKVEGNVTGTWTTLTESDAHRLREASADFRARRGLILWLPLRRDGLAPAPDAGFSSNQPTLEGTVRQVDKPDDLRSLLTTLRHLRVVEIRENGETRHAVSVLDGDRLLGPNDWREGARTFDGVIATGPGDQEETRRFVAREAIVWNDHLRGLRNGDHWPKTHSALSSKPTPEKGEPHGAATLVRIVGPGSTLEIDWAVFLPISETDRKSISINRPNSGCFRLLLHGYFFLDSGRRRIEGLGESAPTGAPSDEAELRRAWNAELRDSVVLPLVPAVLLDALKGKLATSAELAAVTAAVARNHWFKGERRAICRNGALARVLEAPSAVTWRIIPGGTSIRPLPKSIADHPKRMRDLFEEVHSWADERGIALCVDEDAALTAEPMCWTRDELGSLFKRLSSRVFLSPALAELLADFLKLAVHTDAGGADANDDRHQAIGPHIVHALRATLQGTAPLAPFEHITRILSHVPGTSLFRLPTSVEHRQVLRVLAGCDSARKMLPVRGAWVTDAAQPPTISAQNVGAFLRALEPLIEAPAADSLGNTDQAAQAAMSALALLRAGGGPAVAVDDGFADVKVLRGREPLTGKVLALSIRDLVERSEQGLLFGPSPGADRLLKLLVVAAPDARPVIIDGKAAEYLNDTGGQGGIRLLSVGKGVLLAIVKRTSHFGGESARAELIEGLNPGVEDDREALRRLCAGDPGAGAESAELRVLSEASNGIERIVKEVFGRRNDRFLLPWRIAGVLSPRVRRHLGIEVLDEPRIETLLGDGLDAVSRLAPTEAEREAFLLIDFSDSLLRRLPIHALSDGVVGRADGVYVEIESEWPVPTTLKQEIVTVQPCRSPKAHERQKKLIRHWSPTAQIETALRAAKPHILGKEILDALAALSAPSGDCAFVTRLRKTPWLAVVDVPASPADILALPPSVAEQAGALLTTDGAIPAFVPADALPGDIEEHPGFQYVREHLLPDEDASLAVLARMITNAELVGLVAPIDMEHAELVNDLATLAKSGGDLPLPGWPLLAAVLASLDPTRAIVRNVASSFRRLTRGDHEPAGRYLDALAGLAAGGAEPERKAARRLYEHGFEEVADWSDDARCKVFGGTRVPTEDGGWRTGAEVVRESNGVAATHVLKSSLAGLLRKGRIVDSGDSETNPMATSSLDPSDGSFELSPNVPDRNGFTCIDVDLAKLETDSAQEQRRFLEPWRDHVPPDLVVVYLALIGRYRPMREVAEQWRPGATTEVGTLWEQLDERMRPLLGGRNPAARIDERRFRIREIAGKHIQPFALSGDRFEAPLDDQISGLVVGNAHTRPQRIRSTEDGQLRWLVEIQYRSMDLGDQPSDEVHRLFRGLVEAIARDCHSWFMSDAWSAFKALLDEVCRIDQAMLKDTLRLLRDRLPTILVEMKFPDGSACRRALQEYQREESRLGRLSVSNDGPKHLDDLKDELWKGVDNALATEELLSSARSRIEDHGYSANRILFELFQNADDAYEQLDDDREPAVFRVEFLDGDSGMQVVHWGRLINHLGANTDEGYRFGRDRDLLNMLVMNFSEKPTEGDLTGKFGLGFKSVHLISDDVGIVSGFIALRTRGGILPQPWPKGIETAKTFNRDGRQATVIDVPFSSDRANNGRESVLAFRDAMTWLSAFARRIKRIELAGVDSETLDCTISRLSGQSGQGEVDVITVSTATHKQRALRCSLGGGYSLLLAVDRDGPCCFPNNFKRVWNLAPLEEDLRSGWLLNGPFPVDPGRGRLAGSVEARQKRFRGLGEKLGERLLALYDAIEIDWKGVAEALDIDVSGAVARARFWKQLFDVVSRDLDDEFARFLHARDRGYGHLVAERQVVPTGLPAPFDGLVSASDVRRYTDGALTDSTVLARVGHWPELVGQRGRVVTESVAERLRKVGFGEIRPLSLADLLRRGFAENDRIDADVAVRFGRVVTPAAIEKEPLYQERKEILDVVRKAKVLARDDAWRPVKELSFESKDEDERLICGFAPTNALLHGSYQGTAIEFFQVARSTSGYGPKAELLRTWAEHANDTDGRKAVLHYVVHGRHGRELAGIMRSGFPAWLPRPIDRLRSDPLLEGWSEEDVKRLLIELGEHDSFDWRPDPPAGPQPISVDAVRMILNALFEWWENSREDERREYSRCVYPDSFSADKLRKSDDRRSWFTMLALACFQSFGRAQDQQHRGFIDWGNREGWWREIAESMPPAPDELQPWLTRLERWSRAERRDRRYKLWERTLVDLYTIARWLPQYTELFRKLPHIVREERTISLKDVLRPGYWPAAGRLGLEAAPLDFSLGIGVNWLIRELTRNGIYARDDAKSMAPYCWMPSGRVRDLLALLGVADLSPDANSEDSRTIHAFVVEYLGEERARFGGDFDLPLQLITRSAYRDVREQCFQEGGLDASDFNDAEDAEDEFTGGDPA